MKQKSIKTEKIIPGKNTSLYCNDPFVAKKAKEARKFIDRVGLPPHPKEKTS